MIQLKEVKLRINHTEKQLQDKIVELCRLRQCMKDPYNFTYTIVRQSIDARKKPDIFYIYTLNVEFSDNKVIKYLKQKKFKYVSFDIAAPYIIPDTGDEELKNRPVIVGSGPCGLFCAYLLAQRGFKPIIVDRGEAVEERIKSVNDTFEKGTLNEESNVQFGEGGAGTFSDGKLNTLTKDINGRNSYVLKTFADFGAPVEITYKAKPHIGTDLLTKVVSNMRKAIIELGGEFLFSYKLVNFNSENEKLKSIELLNVKNGEHKLLQTDICVLAIGHSARDTFSMLYEKNIVMQQKSFAVGFRVSHKQKNVNLWQYGVEDSHDYGLEAADYKVANECENGRRVYSFCMCPGGYVVNASSEKGKLCVNGMSESKRDSEYANSAIICAVNPEDFLQSEVSSEHPLSGMYYQRNIEKIAYEIGNGKIPAQYFVDFENNTISDDDIIEDGCVKGLVKAGNLRTILSEEINQAIIESIHKFGYTRKGFDDPATILYGVEARTSSPIRIFRDGNFESSIKGIYPCGEGAGYAGGITSAATDGIKVAETIIQKYKA